MSKKETHRLQLVKEVDDIICDCCGESCKTLIGEFGPTFNYAIVLPSFGYGSDIDNEYQDELHLCEKCFLRNFKA